MVLRIFLIFLIIVFYLGFSNAEEDSLVDVIDIKTAKKVIKRIPKDISDEFPKNIKKVYCWTRIKAFEVPTFIFHEWYYKNKLMARVKLQIRNPVFRTWSSKKIVAKWTGKWRVVVKDKNGSIVASKEFHIK